MKFSASVALLTLATFVAALPMPADPLTSAGKALGDVAGAVTAPVDAAGKLIQMQVGTASQQASAPTDRRRQADVAKGVVVTLTDGKKTGGAGAGGAAGGTKEPRRAGSGDVFGQETEA